MLNREVFILKKKTKLEGCPNLTSPSPKKMSLTAVSSGPARPLMSPGQWLVLQWAEEVTMGLQ